MTVRSFEDACRFLYPRIAGGIKWGLETTERLVAALGHPQRHFASVHIGGTNGKGSTSAMLAAILQAQGFRVGLYTSPHLVSFTERMLVDGVPATEAAITAWVKRLEPLAMETGASFFEITTAIAFADLAARGADIAVIEVGLGGRLDATNVITPLAAGVTRIALEHTDYLGPDLVSIAGEKAGIAKTDVPFLTTEADPEIRRVLLDRAAVRGAGCAGVDPQLAAGYRLGLQGPHQVANASLAMALARVLPEAWRPDEDAIRAGLAGARLPGRFDRRGKWLFDVAHNPDGMRALVAALEAADAPRPITAVVAILKDKDWRQMLDILRPAVNDVILARTPSAPADRSWAEGTVDLRDALEVAKSRPGTALVTGSFHTVGDAMGLLGIDPLA